MSRKLLIIDDEKGITRSIRLVAEREGYEVTSLPGADRAVEIFAEFVPDIVMLDLVMPERDGIDVLQAILLTDPNARVVLMSGYDGGLMRLGSELATFHGSSRVSTLKKPFRRAELLAVLQPSTAVQPVQLGA
jgi:DNA-binding NtrC family response regulator